eukprot:jgi/Picre1/35865/NNA_003324.t1
MNWAQVLLRGAVAIGGLATFTVGLLYALQEKIIYVPVIPGVPRGYIALPEEYGLDYEDIWIRSKMESSSMRGSCGERVWTLSR